MAKMTIIHIPHASIEIPSDVRNQFTLTDADLQLELLRMTDWYTDELFQISDAKMVSFPVSRLVLDPERFADDDQEVMSKRGMGVVYTHTSQGTPLRRPLNHSERRELIDRFYRVHHHRFETAVSEILAIHDRCLIIDAHSFPSHPLPYELFPDGARPSICVGTNPFHTPQELVDLVSVECESLGWGVQIDHPFKDTIVPMRYYKTDQRVKSIMIEVRRDLYMNEGTGEKNNAFEETKGKLQHILMRLSSTQIP